MNKSILWLISLLFVTSLSIVSCSETDGGEDPYANWEERNQRYIDSIATVAEANQGNEIGQWKIIRSYKLPPLSLNETGKVNDYVYCKILANGDGVTPLFTDTVEVNYRGKLIDKTVFDQSYTGELDPEVAVPSKMVLYGQTSSGSTTSLITGWQTALMNMKVGDRWDIYIPYELAYGTSGSGSILGYSTLIFDLDLVNVCPLKGTERSLLDSGEGIDIE